MTSDPFQNRGFRSAGVFNLTPREAYDACKEGALILDIRESELNAHKTFDVPEVRYIPFSELKEHYQELSPEDYLIVADSAGIRIRLAILFLQEKGFQHVAGLAGGLVEWEHDQMPIKINPQERLSGACVCMLRKRTHY